MSGAKPPFMAWRGTALPFFNLCSKNSATVVMQTVVTLELI